MNKIYKILVLLAIPIILLSILNFPAVVSAGNFIVATGGMWWILGLIILGVALYYIVDYFDLLRRVKVAKAIKERRIPQIERIEIMKRFIIDQWRPIIGSQPLTLVSIYGPPERKDAASIEAYMFTTNKSFMDKRIKAEDIPTNEIFCGWMDCYLGEPRTLDIHEDTGNFVSFIDSHWGKSIQLKEKTAVDKILERSLIQGMGEETGREEAKKVREGDKLEPN